MFWDANKIEDFLSMTPTPKISSQKNIHPPLSQADQDLFCKAAQSVPIIVLFCALLKYNLYIYSTLLKIAPETLVEWEAG